MRELRPGFDDQRLIQLMRAAVQRCQLDLSGATVLTEAASGAYVVTPVLAALAGAETVYALTRSTWYGTLDEITARTLRLARLANVQARIKIITEKNADLVSRVDIITNSGHVRPIDAEMVSWMKPSAVIPLMYEAWEFRPGDVDLEACRRRGIRVAGTNERHPAVDVFSYLGIMAIKLLVDAGIAVYKSTILVLCDNPFLPFLRRGLTSAGAAVETCSSLTNLTETGAKDAILVALLPKDSPAISALEAGLIAHRWPGTAVAQFWGDLDRSALTAAGVPFWPVEPPLPGHMGILPSHVGPEPIVRLQAGGLKVAELLACQNTGGDQPSSPDLGGFVQYLTNQLTEVSVA